MPQHRDPRYRGRRTTAPPRLKPGHLRTNYAEDDLDAFAVDLAKIREKMPESVIEGDRRAVRLRDMKQLGIVAAIILVPVSLAVVWGIIEGDLQWWILPVVQTAVLAYLGFGLLTKHGSSDTDVLIYREADRRGIKYQKGVTPLYAIMNRINADYNSRLWNRNFKWK
jgi:hypothetical protein